MKKGDRPWMAYRLDEVLAHINDVEVPAVLWGEGEKCVEIALTDTHNQLQELSVTEEANMEMIKRLSEFPEWYQLSGTTAVDGAILGNAVPPAFVSKLWQGFQAINT